jgi:hypothetical protein
LIQSVGRRLFLREQTQQFSPAKTVGIFEKPGTLSVRYFKSDFEQDSDKSWARTGGSVPHISPSMMK